MKSVWFVVLALALRFSSDANAQIMVDVISPDGGEYLVVGESHRLSWASSMAGREARLEYSTDGGVEWRFIAHTHDDFYNWSVPATLSDKCLLRVQYREESDVMNLTGHVGFVNAGAFNAAGTLAGT